MGKWRRWIEWTWFQNLKKWRSWDKSFKMLKILKKIHFLACNFWNIDFFKIIQKTIKSTHPWLQNDIKKSWSRRSQFYAKKVLKRAWHGFSQFYVGQLYNADNGSLFA